MAKPTAAQNTPTHYGDEGSYATIASGQRLDDLEQRIETLTAALAQKDKQHEAMVDLICEMNGRLFCYEMNHGVRGLNSARFDVAGLSFRYPGSFDTYKMIHELTKKRIVE